MLRASALTSTVLAVAAFTSFAVRASPQEPGGRQGGRGGPPFGSPLVTALDTDRDGVISAAELDAAPAALKALDRNKDGRIDRAELMPIGPGREGGGREGGRAGRGAEPGETGAPTPDELTSMLMAYDTNKDGQLTKAELPERLQPIFDRADANKDGKLTADEIKKAAAATSPPNARGGGEGREREGDDREERAPVDRLFRALDTDHDGALQPAEIAAAPAALRTLDTNKDGKLTADEFRQTGRIG